MSVTTPHELTGAAPRPPLLADLGEMGDSGLLLGMMLIVIGVATGVAAALVALA